MSVCLSVTKIRPICHHDYQPSGLFLQLLSFLVYCINKLTNSYLMCKLFHPPYLSYRYSLYHCPLELISTHWSCKMCHCAIHQPPSATSLSTQLISGAHTVNTYNYATGVINIEQCSIYQTQLTTIFLRIPKLN